MKKYILVLLLILTVTCKIEAQGNKVPMSSGKTIYIPKNLQGMDLQNLESKWSYHRMACTEHFVIFWEKGFGKDLSNLSVC